MDILAIIYIVLFTLAVLGIAFFIKYVHLKTKYDILKKKDCRREKRIGDVEKDLEEEKGKNKALRAKNRNLQKVARTDTLTGLNNQGEFNRLLNLETRRAKRYNHSLVLLFIDLNNFKEINDKLDHNFGNLVLKEFASLMEKETRLTDILCRAGGDEFAIIFPEAKYPDVIGVIQRVSEGVEELKKRLEIPDSIDFGISIGGSEYEPEMQISEFVKIADEAMYVCKKEIKIN